MVWGRASKTKYRMPKYQKPDGAMADSTKRLASRYYQLKTGHPRTGQYLHWAKVRPDAQCWWCKCPSQTRDHILKVCPEWKTQQKILWAEVLKETKRWKSRWTVRGLLVDGRCERAVLDFLASTDVGRRVPPVDEEDNAGSEVSEWELREHQERQEEREEKAEALGAEGEMGAGEGLPLFLATPDFMAAAGEDWGNGPHFSIVLSFVNFLGRVFSFSGQAWGEGKRGACNEPLLRGLRTGKLGKMYAAMIYIGRMRVRVSKKKPPPDTSASTETSALPIV